MLFCSLKISLASNSLGFNLFAVPHLSSRTALFMQWALGTVSERRTKMRLDFFFLPCIRIEPNSWLFFSLFFPSSPTFLILTLFQKCHLAQHARLTSGMEHGQLLTCISPATLAQAPGKVINRSTLRPLICFRSLYKIPSHFSLSLFLFFFLCCSFFIVTSLVPFVLGYFCGQTPSFGSTRLGSSGR